MAFRKEIPFLQILNPTDVIDDVYHSGEPTNFSANWNLPGNEKCIHGRLETNDFGRILGVGQAIGQFTQLIQAKLTAPRQLHRVLNLVEPARPAAARPVPRSSVASFHKLLALRNPLED